MTFLQPFILWGLPLILIPVVIHLLNRIRHRPQPWAAMQFLLAANKNSVSQAKLRQFLILLLRVLAVLMLIVFLSRPLAGGWLGWTISSAPDVILILLDRSASMEARLPGGATKREQALRVLAEAARPFDRQSHLVLLENVLRSPQELPGSGALAAFPLTRATDTAADLPSMLQVAANWLVDNRAGTAEIWIASDLQDSNWHKSDTRWADISAKLAALPQKVRVRLLSFPSATTTANKSVGAREVLRRIVGPKHELLLTFDVASSVAPQTGERIPASLNLDGAASQIEIPQQSQSMVWRHRTEIAAGSAGWGSISLPADANNRDNTAYFVYPPDTALKADVVAADPSSARPLQLAAAWQDAKGYHPASLTAPGDTPNLGLKDSTLVLWQAPLPDGAVADRLRQFVAEGGSVVFFPPGAPDIRQFQGVGWGEVSATEAGQFVRMGAWEQNEGPMARTDEGSLLPVNQLTFQRRQAILGRFHSLASYDDGAPFLARQNLGKGEFYFVGSLPAREWSNLGSGRVLVPMLQRLLLTGSRKLRLVAAVDCGEVSPEELAKPWVNVDAPGASRDPRSEAGVFRSGDRWMAVNRPAAEDSSEFLEASAARALFVGVPVRSFEDDGSKAKAPDAEVWRLFLGGMLTFLLVEGFLLLPRLGNQGPAAAASPRSPLAQPTR